MRTPALLVAASLSWTLSPAAHARCVGEDTQVTVVVSRAGASVPGAATKVAWVADGMDPEFIQGSADDRGSVTFTLSRPVAEHSRWPAGHACTERVADLEVCASDAGRDERCTLLHRPEATSTSVKIDLQSDEPPAS